MEVSAPLLSALVAVMLAIGMVVARKLPPSERWRGATISALLLFLLAALGPEVSSRGADRTTLLVDVSASTGIDIPDLPAIGAEAGLGAEQCRVVLFGRASLELEGEGWPALDRDAVAVAGPEGSDLAGALYRAARSTGPGAVVVVATDGRVDVAAVANAAAALRARGLRIRFLGHGRPLADDFRLDRVGTPSRVKEGSGVVLDVSVSGPPAGGYRFSLQVDGRPVRGESRRTARSGRDVFRIDLPVLPPGYHELTVDVQPGPGAAPDPRYENNRRWAGVVVGGAARAMLVGADWLEGPLAALGFQVELAPANRPPDRLRTDLVVVRDTAAPEFGDGGAAVREYVAAGGGLLLLGGAGAFGPGGYSGRAIEECLPLRCASGAGPLLVVVLLDCSGTMQQSLGGGRKLTAAKAAILALAGAMGPDSRLMVVPFRAELLAGGTGIRMGETGAPDRIAEVLAGIDRGQGGTALLPPLGRALDLARRDGGGKRTLTLLVSDGRLENEEPDQVLEVAAALRRAGGETRFAAFGIGDDADLRFLSSLVGSPDRVTRVTGRDALQRAFVESLLRVEGEGQVLLGERQVEFTGSRGAPYRGGLPPVRGLARTARKNGAGVWFTAEGGHPLVAGWRYGLGLAAAVTTDPLGAWAPGWSESALLPALAEHLARPSDLRGVRIQASLAGGRLRLRAHCASLAARLGGLLLLPGGARVPVTLVVDGPGTYSGELPAPPPGPARLTLAGGETRFDGGVGIPYSEEYGVTGVDADALARLRSLSGEDPPPRHRSVPVAPWIALGGVLLLLLDRRSHLPGFRRLFLKMRMASGR